MKKTIVLLAGYPATGKSYLCNKILEKLPDFLIVSQDDMKEKLFDQYVLGGVDILYEKLIESATSTEDYLKNLYDFMEDMDDRYNQTIDSDQISSLCRLAKK